MQAMQALAEELLQEPDEDPEEPQQLARSQMSGRQRLVEVANLENLVSQWGVKRQEYIRALAALEADRAEFIARVQATLKHQDGEVDAARERVQDLGSRMDKAHDRINELVGDGSSDEELYEDSSDGQDGMEQEHEVFDSAQDCPAAQPPVHFVSRAQWIDATADAYISDDDVDFRPRGQKGRRDAGDTREAKRRVVPSAAGSHGGSASASGEVPPGDRIAAAGRPSTTRGPASRSKVQATIRKSATHSGRPSATREGDGGAPPSQAADGDAPPPASVPASAVSAAAAPAASVAEQRQQQRRLLEEHMREAALAATGGPAGTAATSSAAVPAAGDAIVTVVGSEDEAM